MNAPSAHALSFAVLEPGDATGRFRQRTLSQAGFSVDTLAGRYIVLCFLGTAGDAAGQGALDALARHRALFDDERLSAFGVSIDPEDASQGRLREALPGLRMLLDHDAGVSRACGAVPREDETGPARTYRRFWLVIDPTLHVLATIPFAADDPGHERVFALLAGLPEPSRFAGFELPAPVLVLPAVFEPGFCRRLIGLYEADGGTESGVMRENASVLDRSMKSRRDYTLEDPELIRQVQRRIMRRIVPEIERVFFMKITRMERYLVGCYAAEAGGHFNPHRDNTQAVTAHRRFAVSINLNGGFEGGEVSFPEYSRRGYKAPAGWAVVFPCNALHAVARVRQGRRYAFLPFLYDEEGSRLRQANLEKANQEAARAPAANSRAPSPAPA